MSIAVRDLVHVYHPGNPLETIALGGVSFEAPKGCWVAVVGHTGSGKSTLAQHLNGLLLPASGSVSIDGISTDSGTEQLRMIRQKVGLVFQYPEQQLFEETVYKEVSFGPRNWGFSRDEVSRNVESALSQVGIGRELFDANPFRLSGGQKRRVAIASVLSSKPDYIVLDEPTAGLDLSGKRALLDLLKGLKSKGQGVVHVTHDMDLALGLADIVLVLDRGKSRLWGPPGVILGELLEKEISGLVIPQLPLLAGRLREMGLDVTVTLDPVILADSICRSLDK
jgi:energy-coupling factor transport system ATP-binding protein